jgi:type IV secretory pathway protease TraF
MATVTFKVFFMGELRPEEREPFATKVGSTRGYLTQVAYGNKRIGLGLADAIVAVSERRVTLGGLPLTETAIEQRRIREGRPARRRREPSTA